MNNPYRETLPSHYSKYYCRTCHIELRIIKECDSESKCYFPTKHHHLRCDRCQMKTIRNVG